MPVPAIIPATPAYIQVVAIQKLVDGFAAQELRSVFDGGQLHGPGNLFRLYLHFVVWSGTRNFYIF